MFGLHVHVCLACLACLLLMPLQTEEVLSPRNLSTSPAGVASLWGWSMGALGVGTPRLPRLEYALELVLYMLSQHHAIGLQTDCMVTVLAPVVEAARLPRVCPMALGYGLPPL